MIKIATFLALILTVCASDDPKRGLKGVRGDARMVGGEQGLTSNERRTTNEVTLSMSGQSSTISGFLGYNAGDHAAKVGPWTDESFNDAVKALSPSTIRFPCGTGGNYWDWQKGCETGSCPGTSTLENFKITLDATNASAVLVLNMLTDTLSSQMDMLAHATSIGIKIVGVELGNEFYNQEADYVKAFPEGSDYATAANTWLKSIRATYPTMRVSVVGVPSYRSGNKPRLLNWNKQLFAGIVGFQEGDGVTMHEYDATGVPLSSSFTQKDVPTMLGTPFINVARISNISDTLPSWASIWITEYNLLYNTASKPDVPAYGTWAHGLYIATETLLFANTPKIAGGHQCRHALMSFAADGTLFEDTASFDFDESPDKKLVTELYGQSAVAVTLSLIGKASFGMTSATPISFSSNPPVNPGGYPSLVGTFFGQGTSSAATAVIINLADSEFKLTQNDAINFHSFDQVSIADATTPVNKAVNDVTYKSGSVQSSGLTLPPYSVCRLY